MDYIFFKTKYLFIGGSRKLVSRVSDFVTCHAYFISFEVVKLFA